MSDGADIDVPCAALAAAEARADAMEAEAATARAEAARAQADASGTAAVVATLKLEVEKLRRALHGQRSERQARLLDQLERRLEEVEAAATEDELAAERAAARSGLSPSPPPRHHPGRKPFPAHLPRERAVVEAPRACGARGARGSGRIVKLGEGITETPEVGRRRWKVIQTVRERFACRDRERITRPPAPVHPTPRGWAGPGFLATLVFESEPSSARVRGRWRAASTSR